MENENQPLESEIVTVDAGTVDDEPKQLKPEGGNKNPNMKRNGRPKHGEEAIAKALQRKQALQYRMMGLSYEQIGEKLGITHNAAWENVDKALKEVTLENAKEVKKLELQRLDAMFIPAYGNAMRGDLQALNGVMQIMNRRAKLLGLDEAVQIASKVDATVKQDGGVMVIGPVMSPEEWMAAAKAQQAALVTDNQPVA